MDRHVRLPAGPVLLPSDDRGSPRYGVWALLLVAALASGVVSAQPTGGVGSPGLGVKRPSEERLPLPEYERPVPLLPLHLPPAPSPPEERAPVPPRLRFYVREFKPVGNTVFSTKELKEFTAPYVNRAVTSEDLEAVRHALTLHYVNHGYINSGAVIPDQKITDGVIEIHIVEGRLTDVEVEGIERLSSKYLSKRLFLGAGPPLNVTNLQEQLQILLQSPHIDRMNVEIGPGDLPGEAILRARVHESRPYYLGATVDNHLSPSVGEVQAQARGGIRNVFGSGDTLGGEIGFAEGLDDLSLFYSLPITPQDTMLNTFFDRSRSTVVEEPFDLIDIEGRTTSYGVRLSHPFYRTQSQQFMVSLGLDRRSSRTYLLGQPFSFSLGVPPDGETDVTVVRFGQEWIDRSQKQVIAVRSTFSFGIDALGATINETDSRACRSGSLGTCADGEFFAWLGQFQWARRTGEAGGQIIFRADAQLTKDSLLPLEQFAVGGALSVRGYRQNVLVRDRGYSASLEYRHPIFRDEGGRSVLQLAPFVDVGAGRFVDRPSPKPHSIASIGVGLRWDPHPKVHANLYWGHALDKVETPSHDLQDSGIHFSISANLFD